jgi:hypothetical protein
MGLAWFWDFVCWFYWPGFLSTALEGWDVGLAPMEGGRWEVRFGRLILGHMETANEGFLPIVGSANQEAPKRHDPQLRCLNAHCAGYAASPHARLRLASADSTLRLLNPNLPLEHQKNIQREPT